MAGNKPKSKIKFKGKRQIRKEELSETHIKIYVWELPIRVFHWINVIAILLLTTTGFFIGRPITSAPIPEDAYYSFFMGWVRYVHFFTAFVFSINLLVRWYWVFKGNVYATSNPLKKGFWPELWETMKYYLLLKNKKPHFTGHNPLAQLSYWIFIGFGSLIIMATGYYLLFEPQPESIFGTLFVWVPTLFGGDSFTIRSWHHLVAWGFVMFTVIHVYMAFREDWLEKNGTMSSIFTGYKTEKKELIEEHSHEEQKHAK